MKLRWTISVFLAALWCVTAQGAVTAWKTAGTETDSGACYSNDTAHAASDVTDTDDPPQTGRVEGSCVNDFELSNFGFTTGDIPTGSTINGITVNYEAHGGTASQANRRRVDVWIVFSDDTKCTSAGAPGRDNHQLSQGIDLDSTWTADDLADGLWGCTWTATDIHDVDFGITWAHTTATGGNTIGIDFVRIQVDYTLTVTRRVVIIGAVLEDQAEAVSGR